MPDGLLVINKPSGPTSHDVVARLRRVLGERRIGHTGTLDPLATGVLPLVIGRATRLARFLSASEKSYEAVIRLGVSTDTADTAGAPIGSAFTGVLPSRDAIDRALDAFRGTFLQQPPAFSAKKIGGTRSYKLARNTRQLFSTGGGAPRHPNAAAALGTPPPPPRTYADAAPPGAAWPQALSSTDPQSDCKLAAPASVIVRRLDVVAVEEDRVTLSLDCSAGFYVRSLAHDLGQALGTGAHLERLQRTKSGDFTLADAIDLATAEQDRDRARAAVIPLASMLPGLRAAVLTVDGVRHAIQGRDLGPADFIRDAAVAHRESNPATGTSSPVRLLHPGGELVGIAARIEGARTPGLLHPFVILM
jgi:tRNA pseudouridine55 synthase